jgi:hypothetical protein
MINLGLGSSINWPDEPKIGINDKSKVGIMIIDQLKSSITNMLGLFLIDIFNHQKKNKFTCTVIYCPLLLMYRRPTVPFCALSCCITCT